MTEERMFPSSTACHLVERCRYDWNGKGWLETYVIILEGRHYRVRYIDVYNEGVTGGLPLGWEQPQPIDEHRFAAALQLRVHFPPVSRNGANGVA